MRCEKTIQLKNGLPCHIRAAEEADGAAVLEALLEVKRETDFLAGYAEECTLTPESEAAFLKSKAESPTEVELIALVNGTVAGIAAVSALSARQKLRHRAEFSISVRKEFWGLGLGKALTEGCIEAARQAGYAQLELEVVADNARAMGLYRHLGFQEYGRNPRGLRSRYTGWQTLVLMYLDLEKS